MEPYGRRAKLKQNLVDNHIPKMQNWWEDEYSNVTKKRARRENKKEIENETESTMDRQELS